MRTYISIAILFSLLYLPALADQSVKSTSGNSNYVPSLIVDSPYEGRQMAIKLVRNTIGTIQRDCSVKHSVRTEYADDAQLLMYAAELVALEFRTIAIANNYWREED